MAAKIIGVLIATIIWAVIISFVIYIFKRKNVETKEEKKEIFFTIFARVIGTILHIVVLIFISICAASVAQLISH